MEGRGRRLETGVDIRKGFGGPGAEFGGALSNRPG